MSLRLCSHSLQHFHKLACYLCRHNKKQVLWHYKKLLRHRASVFSVTGVTFPLFYWLRDYWYLSLPHVFPHYRASSYVAGSIMSGYAWRSACRDWPSEFTLSLNTPAGTSGRNVRSQQADSLNTTGIYSVVRHPLYLGNSLMYTGIALLTCNAGFVVVSILLLWLYYERIMYAEEIFLRNKFGDKFLSWADITPAFIPHFRHFRRSPLRFSWKKVLKKEKNGLLALFLVFSVFDVISHTLFQTKINVAFLVLSAVCSAAYIVLKIIKRHTHLLDEKGR